MKRLVKDGGIRDGPIVSIVFATSSNFSRKNAVGSYFMVFMDILTTLAYCGFFQ